MSKKYTYKLVINKESKDKPYSFDYGNTKGIMLSVNKNRSTIISSLGKDYSENISNKYLFSLLHECMRRASLVHVLKYSEPLKIKCLKLDIYNGENLIKSVDLSSVLILYSLIDNKLLRPIPVSLRSREVISEILYQKRGELGSTTAALYAFLFSKTKIYESERFIYLWMTMNGMYSYFYPKGKGVSEKDQIEHIVKRYDLGAQIFNKRDRDDIAKNTLLAISKIEEPIDRDKLSDVVSLVLNKFSFLNIEITPLAYLITDFAYYLRCDTFHAGKPLPLFGFYNDMEIKALRIVNELLEEFLDEHLCDIFFENKFSPQN